MIRLGIIGCGAVTERHHLPALKRVGDIRVVALADADRRRLKLLGRRGQGRHNTFRELIDDHNVDAVAVWLPPQFHAEAALAALEKGKHVFIEKPLALNLADCDRLLEAGARAPTRKVMVGFNLRWHRLVRQARDIINRDELGRIKLVRTIFTSAATNSAWRSSLETGGGVIFDLGVHHFDLVRFLFGSEVKDVRSSTTKSGKAVSVTFSMSNGVRVECTFAEGTDAKQEFEVHGEQGWLRVSLYRANGLERFRVHESPGAMTARLRCAANTLLSLPRILYQAGRGGEFALSYVEEWRHFAEAVLLDKPVEANLLAGRRALEIALAASKAT
jgi:myo-inositol 2-dehydrogenase / D-chiro-inositol 1-dehydrogenase